MNTGLPVLGLTGEDISYPFTGGTRYFNDFVAAGRNSFSATIGDADWLIGGATAASGATSLTFLAGDGGWLKLDTSAAGTECFVMLQGTTASFISAGKSTAAGARPITFQCRAKIDTVTSSNQFFGMVAAAAVGIPGGGVDPIDTQAVGFAFVVASGAVSFQYKTSATTVATTAATFADPRDLQFGSAVTVLAGSTHTFTATYDGDATLKFCMDGRLIKTANLPAFTTAGLSPCMGVDGTTTTVTVDYIYAGQPGPIGGRA